MNGRGDDNSQFARLALIIAFSVSVGIFLINRGQPQMFKQSQIGAENVASPVLNLLSRPIRSVENLFEGFTDRNRALEENRQLRLELQALRELEVQSEILKLKLVQYEKILSANPDWDIPDRRIAARAISEIKGPFVRATLINVGSDQGVKKGHPVMTVDGLYGHVLRVGPKASRVLQLSDLNSRISVMSLRSEARAILAGNNTEQPILAFVNSTADWVVGDQIVTSGDDGVLPQGLPIGTIFEKVEDGYTVELYTSGNRTDWVWVSPYAPIVAPANDIQSTSQNDQAIAWPKNPASDESANESQSSEMDEGDVQ